MLRQDGEYNAPIEEMTHADRLIERGLSLGSKLQNLHKLKLGEHVAERLQVDLKLELGGRG